MKHVDWERVAEEPMPCDAGTLLRRFINGTTMTLGRVTFTEGTIAPTHRHENEQFSIVLSGTMEFTVEGQAVIVSAGQLLHLESNELHGARALTDATVLDVFSPPRADWGEPGG